MKCPVALLPLSPWTRWPLFKMGRHATYEGVTIKIPSSQHMVTWDSLDSGGNLCKILHTACPPGSALSGSYPGGNCDRQATPPPSLHSVTSRTRVPFRAGTTASHMQGPGLHPQHHKCKPINKQNLKEREELQFGTNRP